jgi:hypothetical protein
MMMMMMMMMMKTPPSVACHKKVLNFSDEKEDTQD